MTTIKNGNQLTYRQTRRNWMRHRPERVAERRGEQSHSLQRLERKSVECGEAELLKEKRRAAAQS